jgi:hypothetical protein
MKWWQRGFPFWTAGAVAAAAALWSLYACSATPPLASNLSANFADGEREFDRRIQARFPVGSSAAEIALELIRQGFKPTPERGDSASTRVYSFHKGAFPCDLVWNIVWREDSNGKVTATKGVYGAICP